MVLSLSDHLLAPASGFNVRDGVVARRYVSNRQCVIDGNQSGHVVNMVTTLFAKLQLFLMSKPTEGKFAFIFILLALYAIVK